MLNRRIVTVAGAVTAALLAGVVTAGADPATDTADQHGVRVERAQAPGARAAVDPVPSEFVPLSPTRVLDTRNSGAPVGPGRTVTVDLSTRTPATAVAVVLNVTATAPTMSTVVTVYPAGEARPLASNLNLVKGQTRANAVVVALSTDREVVLHNNSGNTHLIADLAGYYTTDVASRYNTRTPQRVLDTRSGSAVGQGGVVNVDFSFLPASATAVTFNLTAVGATRSTVVTAYPAGQARPLASNLNVLPGEIVPNQVTVRLGANRRVSLHNNSGATHLIVDLSGYYATGSGYYFVPLTPERAYDSRVKKDGLRPSYFVGLTGWSPDIKAVAANLTGVNPSTSQFITVWPGGAAKPNASSLNLVKGQIVANAVTVGIGYEPHPEIDDLAINFTTNAGYVDFIFDVAGLFVELS